MFNEHLEKYRNDLQLRKKEIADKLKVSESYYSLIESGTLLHLKVLLKSWY
ncbi:putative transcriptional regulator [Clostridium saccharoperbutylacetonicum]|uniref:HTH cro/C1-type domain-containing protein n=1 Tax=Clostridium saccharoperbutylacetonicum N1-4(HMT) TaxID=931276 RepID=M1MHN9_9CLOT|nr:helix-turn-helix domain-containing protein [Clostridium saccharoperbutylacetonicum]AGF57439.1 hypothetical protein Cspa_c36790 [Clostridium saccharoperbutylacetonicum N1-4(HMT)]NRT61795.1 putative transcriptional regulator [Clostridium saccharoperbutylacetonicum]NSB25120.1 putative transcriptional regulator [Clostridium saccharoperbutylacetonicum]NSB44491.1 putative transcriptional regulator [Clostridium saccharoperbutylacetonicum]